MRRILHLSDLHFGRTRPDLLDPLVALAADLSPDLVAISGDFTQRARRSQFVEAARFLDRPSQDIKQLLNERPRSEARLVAWSQELDTLEKEGSSR